MKLTTTKTPSHTPTAYFRVKNLNQSESPQMGTYAFADSLNRGLLKEGKEYELLFNDPKHGPSVVLEATKVLEKMQEIAGTLFLPTVMARMMIRNAKPKVSKCCKASLEVVGEGQTHWYVCSDCGMPADEHNES